MKSTLKTFALSTALAASASATQFSAAYVFDDAVSLSATFTGSLDGNLITDITNVSAYVTGTWWPDGGYALTHVQSYTNGGYTLAEGGAVMSLDGSFMNFRLTTENDPDGDWWDRNSLWAAYTSFGYTALYHYCAGDNYTWDSARWSVSVEQEQAFSFARFAAVESVPDGGVAGVLLAVFAGLLTLHRRVRFAS